MSEELAIGIDPIDSDIKIGTSPHLRRNVLIVVAVVMSASAMIGFYRYSAAVDAPRLNALSDFRAAYAKKCDAVDFQGATPDYVANAYLNSTMLQEVVAKQQASLSTSTCADAEKALKAANFPLASKTP